MLYVIVLGGLPLKNFISKSIEFPEIMNLYCVSQKVSRVVYCGQAWYPWSVFVALVMGKMNCDIH